MKTFNTNTGPQKLQQNISYVLQIGVYSSVLLIAAGGLSYSIANSSSLSKNLLDTIPSRLSKLHVGEVLKTAVHGGSEAVILTGILVLMITPVVRIILLCHQYLKSRDFAFTVISFIVLAILLTSIVLGVQH